MYKKLVYRNGFRFFLSLYLTSVLFLPGLIHSCNASEFSKLNLKKMKKEAADHTRNVKILALDKRGRWNWTIYCTLFGLCLVLSRPCIDPINKNHAVRGERGVPRRTREESKPKKNTTKETGGGEKPYELGTRIRESDQQYPSI